MYDRDGGGTGAAMQEAETKSDCAGPGLWVARRAAGAASSAGHTLVQGTLGMHAPRSASRLRHEHVEVIVLCVAHTTCTLHPRRRRSKTLPLQATRAYGWPGRASARATEGRHGRRTAEHSLSAWVCLWLMGVRVNAGECRRAKAISSPQVAGQKRRRRTLLCTSQHLSITRPSTIPLSVAIFCSDCLLSLAQTDTTCTHKHTHTHTQAAHTRLSQLVTVRVCCACPPLRMTALSVGFSSCIPLVRMQCTV